MSIRLRILKDVGDIIFRPASIVSQVSIRLRILKVTIGEIPIVLKSRFTGVDPFEDTERYC